MIFFTLSLKRLLFFSAGLLLTTQVFAQSEVHRTENWISNSGIGRLEHSNGYTMLSGSFTQVGPYTGSAVVTDATSGAVDASMPKVNGDVYVAAPDGSGGWYFGGYFTGVDTVKVQNLVHIRSDKTVDRTWKPNPDNSPSALTVSGSTLYVGGYFTTIAGQPRNHIASFDLSNGNLTSWNPNANGSVESIEVAGALIYVGGYFTNIGTLPRTGLAALNATTGAPTTWNPVITNTFSAYVKATAVDATTNSIYIGGNFNNAGGQPRIGVARLSTITGLATAWTANANASGYVEDLILSGTTLFIGGSFTTINGTARNSIAAVPTLTVGVLAWNPGLDAFDYVYDMSLAGNNLYFGGYFDSVNGTLRSDVAAVDVTTAALQSWAPQPNESINSIYATATSVFIGGYMNGVNWTNRTEGFALFMEATDQPWPFTFDLNGGVVNTIAVKDGILYIGGEFVAINKTPRRNLAAINLSDGQVLPWNPSMFGVSGTDPIAVYSMKIKDNTLYVGGKFFAVNALTTVRPGLAAIDLATGIATNWNPQVGDLKTTSQYVNSIDIVGNTVYAAGSFNLLSGNQARANIAAIDATAGTVLPWAPQSNGMVDKIRVIGNLAYVVGEFANGIGGQIRLHRIAALDLGSNLATAWNPDFKSGVVYDIAIGGPDLYVGGAYDSVANQPRPGLSAFVAATGSLKSWNPDAGSNSDGYYSINSVASSSTKIFISGDFDFLGLENRRGYGEYNTCPAKPIILTDATHLTTNSSGTLQWYNNDVLLAGETSSILEYNPLEYGVYTVTTTVNGCTVESDETFILITQTEMSRDKELAVFPNPVREELSVQVPAASGTVEISVIDMMGRTIKSIQSAGVEHTISARELDAGPYLLIIQDQKQKHVRKIIKIN